MSRSILLALLGGTTALVVAHAIGRFAYTPLLPYFLADGLFDLHQRVHFSGLVYLGFAAGLLLIATYVLQVLGTAAPLLWPGSLGITLCAVLVGGTFTGSVLLTQRLGRTLQPHQGPRLSAALIALYGPWLAGLWIAHGGSLTQSFVLGVAALLWAWFWTWSIPRRLPTGVPL